MEHNEPPYFTNDVDAIYAEIIIGKEYCSPELHKQFSKEIQFQRLEQYSVEQLREALETWKLMGM